MLTIRKSDDRGHFNHGWLNTYHTFSFSRYYDPQHMGFRALRVINEDFVAPGKGFGSHPHDNMEILTYIVQGALEHKDSLGTGSVIKPGDIQRMTAGTGITHSEFNPSKSEPVHLLQIWLEPAQEGHKPSYDQKHFSEADRKDRLRLIASPDAADGSIKVTEDIRLYASLLSEGKKVSLDLKPGRHAWVQVVQGPIRVNDLTLESGDGAAVSDESRLEIAAGADSEFIVFDLP
jgi:redox-sensitive bicupin YhaK (pirin superfamily)